jgi:hypothetical protein
MTRKSKALSSWTLRLDGGFLVIAGSGGLLSDTVGHFFGAGPMAGTLGSPYTIGAFEAHGLAVIVGGFMIHTASFAERRLWHALGLIVHLLLGTANLMFWPSFVQLNVVPAGIVTTALHIAFVGAQAVCLARPKARVPVAHPSDPVTPISR